MVINNTSKNNGENIGNERAERSGVATAKANTTGRSLTPALGKYYNMTNSPTNSCLATLSFENSTDVRVVSRLFHLGEMLRVERRDRARER